MNLEVGGGMEVLAGLPGAPALDEVHADGDAVVVWVDRGLVGRVAVPAVVLAPAAVPAQIVPAHLT